MFHHIPGPQLARLFADLRFTEKILREQASARKDPVLKKLLTNNVPEEIPTAIFSQLDGLDLGRCQRVDRFFHTLIHNMIQKSKLLQYKILLAKAHYKDGPRIQDELLSTSAARTSFLQAHIDGWRNLRNNSQTLSLPLSDCKHFANGVLAWARGRVIHILELPSILRQKTLQRRKFKVRFEPVKILVNPPQDLLVLVECLEEETPSTRTERTLILHFKSLSSGGAHPQAPRSIPFRVSTPNIHVRSFDNLLALAYKQPRTATQPENVRFEIVDWKKGQSLMTQTLTPQDFVVAPCFLTRDFVLTCRSGMLWDYLVIYDISSGAFKETVTLIVGGTMERGTTRTMVMDCSSPTEANSGLPFIVDDGSRAVEIVVNANERLWNNNDPTHTLLICVTAPVHRFLVYAELCKDLRRTTGEAPDPIPLEKWAARNTVLHILKGHVEPTPSAVCGSRTVGIMAGHTLATEDFRPRMRHWVEKPSPEDTGLKWKILFPPGLNTPNLKTWSRTQYVYRVSRHVPHLQDDEIATEIMMDEEHMLIIKTNDEETKKKTRLVDLVIMSINSQPE